MQKNLAFIAKYLKKIYKPTNNNLRTSSNLRNKNVDMTLRYKNDNQSGQFRNQRTINVAGAKENVGSLIVQQSGIQCFNCKEFRHFAKECRKPKRVKDSAYHKEKMLLCKEAEQELEAHYSYMAKIQEVHTADSGTDFKPVDQVQNDVGYNVFANELQHSEQSESNDQNDVESDDERVALTNLIANLKLDVDENKKIQKQLEKANTTLAQELKECKVILAETSKSLGESISVRDSCLVALQTKQAEFEKYKAFNDHTVDYEKFERKLNETLGQLALKDIEIKKGLKIKDYEILVVKQKYDELMKHSLLTKSHYEGLVKQKTKVITNLKLRERHDIEKMLSMEKQLNFLKEIVCKRSQSIQTIHMMAPKVPTYNGRPTFANPIYLKQAQSEIPCLYAFPYDQSTHANKLIPDGEETLALERKSQSKLNKDLVHPYDYTTLNSLYQIFKPQPRNMRYSWHTQMRSGGKFSKSRQACNVMTNNINHFKEIVNNAWIKHSKDQFRAPTAQDIEILIQTCLMPLATKTQNDSFRLVHELKQEMHADLKYVEFLEKEIDELEYDKAEFSNKYDVILQECVSNDVKCSYLQSLSDLDALAELQCLYLHKVIECDCLAQKLSNQTKSVSKEVHNELLQSFAKVEKHSISLEIALQKHKEQNIAISELKKLTDKSKGKSVDTKFDKPCVVRQPNAQRITKPSVLGKPTPFSNSLERIYFPKTKSVPKANALEGLSKPVTAQTLPQTARQAVSNTNVLKPGIYTLTGSYFSLTENNLHQQYKLFNRGNSLTQQWEHFFTRSGKITLAVGTIFHYQWQNNSSSGNSAVGMIFTNKLNSLRSQQSSYKLDVHQLLLSLPDEHQLRFKTLEQTFTRLQVIVGQLQFMGVEVEQDDLNQKFLTSLAPEWLMHTIVWRNRTDLDTMSLDDMYNHLKVYEAEVQKKSEPNTQNMAFISSTKHSRGNDEVNTASVYTASSNVPTASANVATGLINQKLNASTVTRWAISQENAELLVTRRDTYKQGSKAEEQTLKALMAIDGVGWDWSYMENKEEDHALVAEAPTEFALMADTKTLKQEKEVVDGKLAGLLSASKDLDNLIESQRSDKSKEGLGYTAVPPPVTQLYLSPKKDLS
nr:hypothetical protein [Tanacetum cinerariifolium]